MRSILVNKCASFLQRSFSNGGHWLDHHTTYINDFKQKVNYFLHGIVVLQELSLIF